MTGPDAQCPGCGASVATSDRICARCGLDLVASAGWGRPVYAGTSPEPVSVRRFLVPASAVGRIVLTVCCLAAFGLGFWGSSHVVRGPDAPSENWSAVGALIVVGLPAIAILALALIHLVWRRRGPLFLVFAALVGGAAIGAQFGPWWEVHTITGGHLTLQLEAVGGPTLSGPLVCTTSPYSADIESVEADNVGTLGGERVQVDLGVRFLDDLTANIQKGNSLFSFSVALKPGSTASRGQGRLTEMLYPGPVLQGNGSGSFSVVPPAVPAGGTVIWDCRPSDAQ